MCLFLSRHTGVSFISLVVASPWYCGQQDWPSMSDRRLVAALIPGSWEGFQDSRDHTALLWPTHTTLPTVLIGQDSSTLMSKAFHLLYCTSTSKTHPFYLLLLHKFALQRRKTSVLQTFVVWAFTTKCVARFFDSLSFRGLHLFECITITNASQKSFLDYFGFDLCVDGMTNQRQIRPVKWSKWVVRVLLISIKVKTGHSTYSHFVPHAMPFPKLFLFPL